MEGERENHQSTSRKVRMINPDAVGLRCMHGSLAYPRDHAPCLLPLHLPVRVLLASQQASEPCACLRLARVWRKSLLKTLYSRLIALGELANRPTKSENIASGHKRGAGVSRVVLSGAARVGYARVACPSGLPALRVPGLPLRFEVVCGSVFTLWMRESEW